MQSASRQATIAGRPVHPFSSVRVCNQTTPIEMVHLPCGGILHFLHARGNAGILALTDVQDQILYYWMMAYSRTLRKRNQGQALPNPLHSLSKNDALCATA